MDFLNEHFAEFYGAMLGDGHRTKNLQSLCITCNGVSDRWYVENRLVPLCTTLFNRLPRLYYPTTEQAIRFVLNSRSTSRLFGEWGFPAGKKNSSVLEIPPPFFQSKLLLASCLRGIIDTDGGIYAHPNTKIMLNVTTISPTLLSSLRRAFNCLDLELGVTRYQLQAYGAEKIKRIVSCVGSSNPRNILRYQRFLQEGKVPTAKETESLLKSQELNFQVPYFGPVI